MLAAEWGGRTLEPTWCAHSKDKSLVITIRGSTALKDFSTNPRCQLGESHHRVPLSRRAR